MINNIKIMQSQPQQPENKNTDSSEVAIALKPTSWSNFSPTTNSIKKGQWIATQIYRFLAQIPNYLGNLFNEYKQLIISVAIILAAFITVKVVLAVMDALNDIPLLSLILELIGIGYSGWFVYRYLLKESTRQELAQKIALFLSSQQ